MFKLPKITDLDQLRIMQYLVLGATEYKNFCSPFRPDKKPGCWLNWYNNVLYYHDPKDTLRNGKNIVKLWALEKNVSEIDAKIEMTNFTGGLLVTPAVRYTKPKAELKYKLREWQDYDEEYWLPYGLTIPLLEKGSPSLYPLEFVEYYSQSMRGRVRSYSSPEKPMYAYFWDKDTFKVYSPKSKMKFLGNCSAKDFYFYSRCQDKEYLFITSSGKDAKVCFKELSIDSLAPNGEMFGLGHYPLEIIKDYKKVIVGFDNDSTGIEFGEKLVKYLQDNGIDAYMSIPEYKDFAETFRIRHYLPKSCYER